MKLSELGIVPAKEKQFNSKNIYTVEDLIRYLPRKYMDFTHVTGILPETEISCITAMVDDVRKYNGRIPVIQARCTIISRDEPLTVTWFHQNYMFNRIQSLVGERVFIAGKITRNVKYSQYTMACPEVFEEFKENTMRIVPVYSKIAGMSDDYLNSKIETAMEKEELFSILTDPEERKRTLIIDVRDDDLQDAMILGAINIPSEVFREKIDRYLLD